MQPMRTLPSPTRRAGQRSRRRCPRRWLRPRLRLTAYAWAKLLFLRDIGQTEVGAFGVSRAGDLLLVTDVELLPQTCTLVTVKFDDQAVADYFDRQVDAGRAPEQFARIWIHTHPGECPKPSATDEDTFARCFGNADWAVMFIVARGGQTYARLRYGRGPGGQFPLPVEVDFGEPFPAANPEAWRGEYAQHVCPEADPRRQPATAKGPAWPSVWIADDPGDRWERRSEIPPTDFDLDLIQELYLADF